LSATYLHGRGETIEQINQPMGCRTFLAHTPQALVQRDDDAGAQ
jgi:hypothetical protein